MSETPEPATPPPPRPHLPPAEHYARLLADRARIEARLKELKAEEKACRDRFYAKAGKGKDVIALGAQWTAVRDREFAPERQDLAAQLDAVNVQAKKIKRYLVMLESGLPPEALWPDGSIHLVQAFALMFQRLNALEAMVQTLSARFEAESA
jgi:hypothetical protein